LNKKLLTLKNYPELTKQITEQANLSPFQALSHTSHDTPLISSSNWLNPVNTKNGMIYTFKRFF